LYIVNIHIQRSQSAGDYSQKRTQNTRRNDVYCFITKLYSITKLIT